MKQTSYLEKITYDNSLESSWIGRYLRNPRLFLLIIIAVVALGIISFLSLPRRLNPEVNIPIVTVATSLPGASPNDIESLVTIPIEDNLSGIENVSRLSSNSQPSFSIVSLEFASGTNPDKARSDVQAAVDNVELPEDASTPTVTRLNFENTPVWSFFITADDTASLMRYSQSLRDELEAKAQIKDVTTSGINIQEIQVVVKPEAVSAYNLNPQLISSQISQSLMTFPAGAVETRSNSFQLTLDPGVYTIEDIRSLVVNTGGNTVPLGDLASVSLSPKPGQGQSFFGQEGKEITPSVRFDVYKTDSADITTAAKEARETVNASLEKTNNQFQIHDIYDTAEQITEQFNHLVRDFFIIVVLIFIALFIFLGLRQAVVAAISIPFTFFISFTVMNITGISINFLSLFSLLLSLGLLVDDTIVVISAMTAYYRTGKFTPYQTSLMVWRDFVVAIFTTTITTVWAFFPLLISAGIIGEFIKSIPIVVSATLLASFFVAMFITMPFIIILLKPNFPPRVVFFLKALSIFALIALFIAVIPKGPVLALELVALVVFLLVTRTLRKNIVDGAGKRYENAKKENYTVRELPRYINDGIISFEPVASKYKYLITKILISPKLRRNTVIMVVIFSVFSYLLLPLGFVKNEFFPSVDNDYIYLNLTLPDGTNSTVTQEKALTLLKELKENEYAEYVTADVGQSLSLDFGTAGAGGSNQVLFTFLLGPEEEREKSSIEIAQILRDEYEDYNGGELTVNEVSGGPPAGVDLQIKLFGDDLSTLLNYAKQTEEYLENTQGITNVDVSIKEGTGKVVFVPDDAQLASLGVSRQELGFWLRLYASGISPDTITLPGENENTDITLRLDNDIPDIESLSSIAVPTQTGNIPLSSLGRFNLAQNPTLITREDGKRTVSVTASVLPGYNIPDKNTNLESFATNDLKLSDGYTWATGGVNEENQESIQSILQAMGISFLLIVTTMVLQFSSFRKAIIVMLVIPLSISGVFILFALTNTPLSFPALIGVLALFGIVVKNAILVVDKIKQNIEIGMDYINAITDGSSSRLEAIALTSITAILGLIPITISDPLWRGLGGAIIAGLAFSGTIMLFFIPVVYFYWFKPEAYIDSKINKNGKQRKTKRN